MGRLIIKRPGLFTSVQDLGRKGFRRFGVPESGAMDKVSAQMANLLVNNEPEAPTLEITMQGPTLLFEGDTVIALAGANLSPTLDGNEMALNTPIQVGSGQILTFGRPQKGIRCYLAVSGGFMVDSILGSASWYPPVTEKGKVERGDSIRYPTVSEMPSPNSRVSMRQPGNPKLQVYTGPEYKLLHSTQQEFLLKSIFSIGENNRMGYQLSAETSIQNELCIITSPVIPGTIQLTPSGTLLVLMRDAQVTGGYPRVLQLDEESINWLAQKGTGEKVDFLFRE